MRLALIGFMGSGKSCLGRILARRLGMPFIDLDSELERRVGRSIAEIFEAEGEAVFRGLEEETLSDLAGRGDSHVLACGGGVVISQANRSLLAKAYITIWIEVPFAELMRRLANERAKRPLLAQDDYQNKARALMMQREALYKSASRLRYVWREGDSDEDSGRAIMRALEESGIFPALRRS